MARPLSGRQCRSNMRKGRADFSADGPNSHEADDGKQSYEQAVLDQGRPIFDANDAMQCVQL